MSNRAWVTLATNDSYGLGALVLAHSLRRVGSAVPAVVLITPAVTEAMRARLAEVFAEVITVDVLDSGDAAHLALLQRPELGITFTKLHCWNLTQYEKCVFLDADTLIVQNCDELFDREELSAAPDVGWPDCFNSGVFVYQPSAETFSNLIKFAQERGSFDGGDQGLLNLYFSDWARGDINKHLPFLYNVTSAAFYSYLPALKQYGRDLKIIHFIGATKPWLQHFNWRTGTVDAPEHLREFLQLWWNLFVAEVHAKLDTSMTGVASHLARIGQDLQSEAVDELVRRQGWEAGNIDYMGADSFANIWAKISHTLSKAPSPPPKQQSPPAVSSPVEPQSSIGGKDFSALKETPPVPAEADSKSLPLEEPLPVPVETDTKQLAPEESLPTAVTTHTKELVQEQPLSQTLGTEEKPETTPFEAETKVVQPEVLPVPVQTETKQLAPEESLPAVTKADTKVLPPEASPVSIEADTKVLPSEASPEPIEADTKVLPSEASPVPIEADSKVLPSEASPVPIEADTKVLPSEASPVQIETDTKVLPTEAPPTPLEAATKVLPTEASPTPLEADTKELSAENKPMQTQAVTGEQPKEAVPVPIEPATTKLSETLPTQTEPEIEGEPLESAPPQSVQADTKEVPLEKPVPESVKSDASPSEEKTELVSDVPVSALGALKLDDKKPAAPDSPPLATTPSKEDVAAVPAAKLL